MSVLIKGMEMPSNCHACDMLELSGVVGCEHAYDTKNSVWGRALNCPLVPVPPHGRLIDGETKTAVEYSIVEPKTNADQIRTRSDEGLAHLLAQARSSLTCVVDDNQNYYWKDVKKWLNWLEAETDSTPTILASEVVRCEECKNYIKHDKRCGVWNHGVFKDDYCSRSQKKEE